MFEINFLYAIRNLYTSIYLYLLQISFFNANITYNTSKLNLFSRDNICISREHFRVQWNEQISFSVAIRIKFYTV